MIIPELTVGVVFNNPEIVFAGFFRKFLSSFFGKRNAGRILECRNHVGEADAAEFRTDFIGVEAVFVSRDG